MPGGLSIVDGEYRSLKFFTLGFVQGEKRGKHFAARMLLDLAKVNISVAEYHMREITRIYHELFFEEPPKP